MNEVDAIKEYEREYQRKYREKNRAKMLAYHKKYYRDLKEGTHVPKYRIKKSSASKSVKS